MTEYLLKFCHLSLMYVRINNTFLNCRLGEMSMYRFSKYLLGILLAANIQSAFSGSECVILLHGIGRTHRSMNKISDYLKKQNYIVINKSYPSTKKPIEAIAKEHIPALIQACRSHDANTIHFVTHSLGGIIVRQYLEKNTLPSNTRIVMLAPPNHGSPVADFLQDFYLFKKIYGPAGQQLGTDKNSVPNQLKKVLPYEVGIITGNYNINPLSRSLFKGENDGKVSVASARLDGANDFLVVPYGHTFIMRHSSVIKQIGFFLKNGYFEDETETAGD